jgi:alpha-L-rhamnosidase
MRALNPIIDTWGEDVDARIPVSDSHGVEVPGFDTGLPVPQEAGAVKELPAIAPVGSRDDAGRTVWDFGRNAGGDLRFTLEGEASATVTFEHSEVMAPGRVWDNRNCRSARAELHYTLKGRGAETCAPMFTFMGFRCAQATITGKARVVQVECVPITLVPDPAGGFSCGVPEVNRPVWNTIRSQRSNFIEVPADCPQRDEGPGWTGDAQVLAGTACWLADSERFLKKYRRDLRHDQRPDGAVPHFSPDPTRLKPISGRGINSCNHSAYGAVCQWLFEGVAGLAPCEDGPGFDMVTPDPLILPALSPVAAWHDCRHGRIEAG